MRSSDVLHPSLWRDRSGMLKRCLVAERYDRKKPTLLAKSMEGTDGDGSFDRDGISSQTRSSAVPDGNMPPARFLWFWSIVYGSVLKTEVH
jgi:hypothetical protein